MKAVVALWPKAAGGAGVQAHAAATRLLRARAQSLPDLRAMSVACGQPPKTRITGITITSHPVSHTENVEGVMADMAQRGEFDGKNMPRLPRHVPYARYREILARQPDPAEPPTPQREWALQIRALTMEMRRHYDAWVAGDRRFDDIGQFRTWCGRDHDGTHLPDGAMTQMHAMQLREVTAVYIDLVAEQEFEGRDEALALLRDAHTAAAELAALPHAERAAELGERLGHAQLESALRKLLPQGPLQRLLSEYGLGGVEGEPRISGASLGPPISPKTLALFAEMAKTAPMRTARTLVIADCPGRDAVEQARAAMDAAGLQHVEIIPLLESRKDLQKLLDGDYRGAPIREVMMAGSDSTRNEGTTWTALNAMRFLLACKEQGFEAYIGKGVSPQRQGPGNSPEAARLLLAAVDEKGGAGPAAGRFTRQGPAALLHHLSRDAYDAVMGAWRAPAGSKPVEVTHADIDAVEKVFLPLAKAEKADRAPDSELSRAYLESWLARIPIPMVGSRDRKDKAAPADAAPAAGDGKAAAKSAPPIKRLFEDRAIKVYTRMGLGYLFAGMAFANVPAEQLDRMVREVNEIRRNGTPGAKLLVQQVLGNWAMQTAALHDRGERLAVWKKAGFDEGAIAKLDKSARFMLSLLERTGFSIDNNPRVRKMVAEDYCVEHVKGDRAGNRKRIFTQTGLLAKATLEYLGGRGTFNRVEAMGQLRRSFHSGPAGR